MAAAGAKLPTWYRTLAVIVGVLSIAMALIVLAFPLLAVWILIFFLAFGLLVMGIDRLVAGISGHPFFMMMPVAPLVSSPSAQTPPSKP